MSRRYTYAFSSAEADRILERSARHLRRPAGGGPAEDAGLLKLNVEEYKLRDVRARGRSAAAGDDDGPPPASETTTAALTLSMQLYRVPPRLGFGAVEGVHLVDFVRRAGDRWRFWRSSTRTRARSSADRDELRR